MQLKVVRTLLKCSFAMAWSRVLVVQAQPSHLCPPRPCSLASMRLAASHPCLPLLCTAPALHCPWGLDGFFFHSTKPSASAGQIRGGHQGLSSGCGR